MLEKNVFFGIIISVVSFVYKSKITEPYQYKTISNLCIEVHRNLPKFVGLQTYSAKFKISCIYFISDFRKGSI